MFYQIKDFIFNIRTTCPEEGECDGGSVIVRYKLSLKKILVLLYSCHGYRALLNGVN